MRKAFLLILTSLSFATAHAAPEIFTSSNNSKLQVEVVHANPSASEKSTKLEVKVLWEGKLLVEGRTWINSSRVMLTEKERETDKLRAYASMQFDGSTALTVNCNENVEHDCDEVTQESLDVGVDQYEENGAQKYRISFSYRQPDNLTSLDRPLQYAEIWKTLSPTMTESTVTFALEPQVQPTSGYFYSNELIANAALKWAANRTPPKDEIHLEAAYWVFKSTDSVALTLTRYVQKGYSRESLNELTIQLTKKTGELLTVDELAQEITKLAWP